MGGTDLLGELRGVAEAAVVQESEQAQHTAAAAPGEGPEVTAVERATEAAAARLGAACPAPGVMPTPASALPTCAPAGGHAASELAAAFETGAPLEQQPEQSCPVAAAAWHKHIR